MLEEKLNKRIKELEGMTSEDRRILYELKILVKKEPTIGLNWEDIIISLEKSINGVNILATNHYITQVILRIETDGIKRINHFDVGIQQEDGYIKIN